MKTYYILNEKADIVIRNTMPCLELRISDQRSVIKYLSKTEAVILACCDGSTEIGMLINTLSQKMKSVACRTVEQRVMAVLSKYQRHLSKSSYPRTRMMPKLVDIVSAYPKTIGVNPYRDEIPSSITWIVTRRCNMKCKYCFMKPLSMDEYTDEEVSLDSVRKMLQEGERLGVNEFSITGGEPFLRDDLLQTIELACKLGYMTKVTTKKCLSRKAAEQLSRIGLSTLELSLDTVNADIGDYLVGVNGHTQKMLSTIRYITKQRYNLIIYLVVTRINISTLEMTIVQLADMGVSSIVVIQYMPSCAGYVDELVLSEEDVDQLEFIAGQYNDVVSLVLDRDTKRGCKQGLKAITILPDGKVTRCVTSICNRSELIAGDIKRQSLYEIWNSKSYVRTVRPTSEVFEGTACFKCKYQAYCTSIGRCVESSYYFSNQFFGPDRKCPVVSNVRSS